MTAAVCLSESGTRELGKHYNSAARGERFGVVSGVRPESFLLDRGLSSLPEVPAFLPAVIQIVLGFWSRYLIIS